jgi:hypothetical protein
MPSLTVVVWGTINGLRFVFIIHHLTNANVEHILRWCSTAIPNDVLAVGRRARHRMCRLLFDPALSLLESSGKDLLENLRVYIAEALDIEGSFAGCVFPELCEFGFDVLQPTR